MQAKIITVVAALSVAPGLLHGQFNFRVAGREAQVHSFASQGFLYSNDNNYLTMETSKGSLAFTDFGANISMSITDKFRVGAQIYDRNVGELGNWRPTLDWATADYRFKDWFGVRGGKVKTVMGLYNDAQDLNFLHTWALMPSSVYPVDVRGDNIAHIGADVYGNIGLKKLGGLSYTAYAGRIPNDMQGGFVYGITNQAMANTPQGRRLVPVGGTSLQRQIDSYGGPAYGADLRWNTPLKGFTAGVSAEDLGVDLKGSIPGYKVPYYNKTTIDRIYAFYVQYNRGNLNFDGEYRKENRNTEYTNQLSVIGRSLRNSRQGYVSLSYRVLPRLELGTYHSRFIVNWDQNHGDPANHIFDYAMTARVNLTKYTEIKIEQHFMDGAVVNNGLNRGFYVTNNPGGLKPDTKMLVVRFGFHI